MSRVKLTLPEQIIFSTQLTVRVTDINYGAHLANDSVLSLMHEARYRMFNSWGYKSDLEIDGFGTIQLDTAIQYKGEGFHGDQIDVNLFVGDVGSRSFEIYYELKCEDRIIALGKTGLAFFDYEASKMVTIPAPFLQKLTV